MYASLRPPSLHKIGSKTGRRYAAPQPVLTRYKLLYIERSTFDLTPPDVEGLLEELWEFQSAFHDCFARSEVRAHFFDYMVGQLSPLERKSIEPMALRVDGGTVRGLQRFMSDVSWDEEQMEWNYRCSGLLLEI